MEVHILDTKVLYRNGCYMRVRRWLKGAHPEKGLIFKGFTGIETIVEVDVFKPRHTFKVIDKEA